MKVNKFEVIVIMNEAMIKFLKDKEFDVTENLRIRECLKDESYFFKISKMEAIKVLQSVGIKQEKIEGVYAKLTSPAVYYDLLNAGKVNDSDSSLTVKYKSYRTR